jgi:stearoyl-CoA desaturase (delta-9 desaturase)
MNHGWEKFFYFLSFFFQGASYISPRAYAIMHRMHHAFADTEQDPHSPKYDHNLFSMMWKTRHVYRQIYNHGLQVDPIFTKDLPDWKSFDRFASSALSRIVWVAIYILIYLAFGAPWWLFPLIALHAVMGPFHGVIINWFAHLFGYINFKLKDTSHNLFPIDLVMLGEGLHNNHHKHGGRANFAWRKFEFDPVYPVIRLLALIHVIKMRRVMSSVPVEESAIAFLAD